MLQDNDFANPWRFVVYRRSKVTPRPGGPLVMTEPYFEIHEHQDGVRVRLQLTGELDIASEPVLRNRLGQLCAEKQPIRLDLSSLEFMDSTGIHLLISAFKHAREDGWQFEMDPDLPPQVEDLFRLTDVERITGAAG